MVGQPGKALDLMELGTRIGLRPHDSSWNAGRLPGDRPRAYVVYVDERDIVWLSDFGGKFTTYRKSTENADVRQTNGRRGEVWLPENPGPTGWS